MATPTLTLDNTNDASIFVLDFGDDENVTSDAWAVSVHELLDEVQATDGPKALVTTGSAKHYSNGLDVPFMASVDTDGAAEYVARILDVLYRLMLLDTPTVAAVNGHAFGMGAFLVIAHDQAVMRDDRGYVCFPEVHIGMSFPERLLTVARASLAPRALRQALMSGNRYSGPDAQAAGIVDAVAPIDELVSTAKAMAAPLAATAGPNLGVIKRQILRDISDRYPAA